MGRFHEVLISALNIQEWGGVKFIEGSGKEHLGKGCDPSINSRCEINIFDEYIWRIILFDYVMRTPSPNPKIIGDMTKQCDQTGLGTTVLW